MKSKFSHLLSCLLGPKILIVPNLLQSIYKENIQNICSLYVFYWVNISVGIVINVTYSKVIAFYVSKEQECFE